MKYINYIDAEKIYKLVDICSAFSLKFDDIINIVHQNSIVHMYDSFKNIYITCEGLMQLIYILKDCNIPDINLQAVIELTKRLERNALNEDDIDRKNHRIILNM